MGPANEAVICRRDKLDAFPFLVSLNPLFFPLRFFSAAGLHVLIPFRHGVMSSPTSQGPPAPNMAEIPLPPGMTLDQFQDIQAHLCAYSQTLSLCAFRQHSYHKP